MSYSNNWLQTLTEAYKNKPKQNNKLNKLQEQIDITEDLLSLIEVLCEEAGLDANELMEETRQEMEDMGHAFGWEKPAPEGEAAASARLARVKASMKRLGKRGTRYLIKTGAETAKNIEDKGPVVHEPTADRRVRARIMQGSDIPAEINDTNFEKMQKSIKGITDRVMKSDKSDKKSKKTKR